ncbi:MAG: biotin/lipoyl-binding protein [Firmicutes bacterium]|nr:biotin/lipoyl-binding protein [Bacillota bacterium]
MKEYKVTVDGRVFNVVVEEVAASDLPQPPGCAVREVSAEKRTEPQPSPGTDQLLNVEAPMPGAIIDVAVKSGDAVKEGDVLVILEAMKMENEITAPRAGTVSTVHVQAGDTVEGGEALVALS